MIAEIVGPRGGEGGAMGFYEVLERVVALLRERGRVTYRGLKREFQLDDACLEDLKDELINAQRLASMKGPRFSSGQGHRLAPSPASASRPRPSAGSTPCSRR